MDIIVVAFRKMWRLKDEVAKIAPAEVEAKLDAEIGMVRNLIPERNLYCVQMPAGNGGRLLLVRMFAGQSIGDARDMVDVTRISVLLTARFRRRL
jgi:hypothetical protein